MKLLVRIYRFVESYVEKQIVNERKKEFYFCGEKVVINKNVNIIYPQNFSIGNNSLIADYTTIFAFYGVSIGDNCLISSGCGISSLNHKIKSLNRTIDDYEKALPVEIGDNVWIGMNVTILPGVKIGTNSIVGAGSVVTKDIPSNEIWAGSPAKLIKKIIYT